MDPLTNKAFDALISVKSSEFYEMVNLVKDDACMYQPREVRDLLRKAFGLGIEVGEARGRRFDEKS